MMRRRGFLAGLAMFAVLPSGARARLAKFDSGTMLERMLVRGLSNGERIVVTRRWNLAVEPTSPDGAAMTITGSQSFVDVTAPAPLAALARIEERRSESLLFPLHLDAAGLILPRDGNRSFAPLPEATAEAAIAFAREHAQDGEPEPISRKFIADLSNQGIGWLSMLPRDLLFPHPRALATRRTVPLPDGSEGVVDLREEVEADIASGLLERFFREAVTTTAGSSLRNSETWRLTREVS